jgi:hypothetical protein
MRKASPLVALVLMTALLVACASERALPPIERSVEPASSVESGVLAAPVAETTISATLRLGTLAHGATAEVRLHADRDTTELEGLAPRIDADGVVWLDIPPTRVAPGLGELVAIWPSGAINEFGVIEHDFGPRVGEHFDLGVLSPDATCETIELRFVDETGSVRSFEEVMEDGATIEIGATGLGYRRVTFSRECTSYVVRGRKLGMGLGWVGGPFELDGLRLGWALRARSIGTSYEVGDASRGSIDIAIARTGAGRLVYRCAAPIDRVRTSLVAIDALGREVGRRSSGDASGGLVTTTIDGASFGEQRVLGRVLEYSGTDLVRSLAVDQVVVTEREAPFEVELAPFVGAAVEGRASVSPGRYRRSVVLRWRTSSGAASTALVFSVDVRSDRDGAVVPWRIDGLLPDTDYFVGDTRRVVHTGAAGSTVDVGLVE